MLNNIDFTANVLYECKDRVNNILILEKVLNKKIKLNKALYWKNKNDLIKINKLFKQNKIKINNKNFKSR